MTNIVFKINNGLIYETFIDGYTHLDQRARKA